MPTVYSVAVLGNQKFSSIVRIHVTVIFKNYTVAFIDTLTD